MAGGRCSSCRVAPHTHTQRTCTLHRRGPGFVMHVFMFVDAAPSKKQDCIEM